MGSTAEILAAAERGDTDAVRALLRADPGLARVAGEYDKTALHWAAEKDQAEVVDALIAAGADVEAVTSWGMTPLEWAANMGSARAGAVLRRHGARLTLWAAAGLGWADDVRGWAGAAHTEMVSDAAYIAARNGHTDILAFLLELGGDPNRRGFFGGTGLHWAALNGHRETVVFLLAHGADPTLEDTQFHTTPWDWAHHGGHAEIAALLPPPA